MVLIILEDGHKGPRDIRVKITAYEETLTLEELLFIIKCVLDSEDSCYPISEGNIGKAMFLNAINEIACGVPLKRVSERYGLNHKGRKLNIIDRRKNKEIEKKEDRIMLHKFM